MYVASGQCLHWCEGDRGVIENGQKHELWHCGGAMSADCGACGYCRDGTGENCDGWCEGDRETVENGQKHETWHCSGYMKAQCGGCSYCGGGGSVPAPTPSGSDPVPGNGEWVNHYDPKNPLNIQPDATRSNNYFILLGDWGASDWTSPDANCQRAVADHMKNLVKTDMAGKTLLFVAALGDNFYATAGKDEMRKHWLDVYGELATDYAWLATLGNHDFGNDAAHGGTLDPALSCPSGTQVHGQTYGGLQLNSDKNGGQRYAGTEKYWLPDYNYHYEFPESLGLEVISVDTNSGYHGVPNKWFNQCQKDHLYKVKKSGEHLLRSRGHQSTAKSVLIIQHYPENDAHARSLFQSGGGGNGAKIISSYGHTHNNDIKDGSSILSGAGGGYKNEGAAASQGYYGYFTVELDDNNGWTAKEHKAYCKMVNPCSGNC